MLKTAIVLMIAGLLCLPAFSQKKGGGASCTNLTGKLILDDTGMQIRSDGNATYGVTLFHCPGQSGDVVLNLGTNGRRIVRDFFERILVSPADDPLPGFGVALQSGSGGFSIGKVFRGYDAVSGYAAGYPHENCWVGGALSAPCSFTTGAGSNFTGTDGKSYSLRWRNPNADLIQKWEYANGTVTDYDQTMDALLNGEYALAEIQVTYRPGATRAEDEWDIEVLPSATSGASFGTHVASVYASSKNKIQRLGYYNMNFKAKVTR